MKINVIKQKEIQDFVEVRVIYKEDHLWIIYIQDQVSSMDVEVAAAEDVEVAVAEDVEVVLAEDVEVAAAEDVEVAAAEDV
jgi:hypothetical protein